MQEDENVNKNSVPCKKKKTVFKKFLYFRNKNYGTGMMLYDFSITWVDGEETFFFITIFCFFL